MKKYLFSFFLITFFFVMNLHAAENASDSSIRRIKSTYTTDDESYVFYLENECPFFLKDGESFCISRDLTCVKDFLLVSDKDPLFSFAGKEKNAGRIFTGLVDDEGKISLFSTNVKNINVRSMKSYLNPCKNTVNFMYLTDKNIVNIESDMSTGKILSTCEFANSNVLDFDCSYCEELLSGFFYEKNKITFFVIKEGTVISDSIRSKSGIENVRMQASGNDKLYVNFYSDGKTIVEKIQDNNFYKTYETSGKCILPLVSFGDENIAKNVCLDSEKILLNDGSSTQINGELKEVIPLSKNSVFVLYRDFENAGWKTFTTDFIKTDLNDLDLTGDEEYLGKGYVSGYTLFFISKNLHRLYSYNLKLNEIKQTDLSEVEDELFSIRLVESFGKAILLVNESQMFVLDENLHNVMQFKTGSVYSISEEVNSKKLIAFVKEEKIVTEIIGE